MLLAESPIATDCYLQVTVGFGTGEITGEFAREQICFGGNSGSVRVPPVARANPSESRPALCQGRTNPTIRCRRLQCALFGVPWLKPTNFVKEHVNEILVGQGFCWLANLLQLPRVGLIFYPFYEIAIQKCPWQIGAESCPPG